MSLGVLLHLKARENPFVFRRCSESRSVIDVDRILALFSKLFSTRVLHHAPICGFLRLCRTSESPSPQKFTKHLLESQIEHSIDFFSNCTVFRGF